MGLFLDYIESKITTIETEFEHGIVCIYEAISSNDKGVLHELLTGKFLNADRHMSTQAKTKHDHIKNKISQYSYNNFVRLAKGTAYGIHQRFGHDIQSAHWSSSSGDIEKITGNSETQQQNPADLIFKNKQGQHVGLSLKITHKKNGKVPIGNPGAGQTDVQLGTDAVKHYDFAKKTMDIKYPQLIGKSNTEKKIMIKSDPAILADAKKHATEAIKKIRDIWHEKLSTMPSSDLSDHIRNNLLHAKKTKIPLYKITTGGSAKDHSIKIEHPETEHNHILNDHSHISVHRSGDNSILFKHRGKTFLRHRLKTESTPIVSSLKGSAE